MASNGHQISGAVIKKFPLTDSASPSIINRALEVLRPLLPVTLPLYRRLQFGRFFDATCLLTNFHLDALQDTEANDQHNKPWLIAFVDRSCRPETEVWLAASWEMATSNPSAEEEEHIDDLLRQLVIAAKNLPVPTSIHQAVLDADPSNDPGADHGGFSQKDYAGHAADTNIMLWGATHERTTEAMKRIGALSYKFKTSLMANYTFVWDVDRMPDPGNLPEGLRWGQLKPEHFHLVRSRTQIPRQDRTLAVLPNIGIFPSTSDAHAGSNPDPVAWVFVGLDGSLTTLHVEKAWRGKGLAKAITTKLFKEKMQGLWEPEQIHYAYGFVIKGNEESEGMCRSLGGVSGWMVYWLRVDLGAL